MIPTKAPTPSIRFQLKKLKTRVSPIGMMRMTRKARSVGTRTVRMKRDSSPGLKMDLPVFVVAAS
ncbi:MAG: hypothetical protein JXB06_05410 [Spirochaetales bacterium]|nr:hypothetical protein [Spirochaetales bacterium]